MQATPTKGSFSRRIQGFLVALKNSRQNRWFPSELWKEWEMTCGCMEHKQVHLPLIEKDTNRLEFGTSMSASQSYCSALSSAISNLPVTSVFTKVAEAPITTAFQVPKRWKGRRTYFFPLKRKSFRKTQTTVLLTRTGSHGYT